MQPMFLSAAGFNFLVAALFLLAPDFSLGLLGISAPENPVWLHLLGTLVGGFGAGYFIIAKAPKHHTGLIWTGAIAKLAIVVVGIIEVIIGNISAGILLPLSVDLLYALLFIGALRTLQSAE